jgi:hypothetical protein
MGISTQLSNIKPEQTWQVTTSGSNANISVGVVWPASKYHQAFENGCN